MFRKILIVILTIPLGACLYTVNLPGPDGQMHQVAPMGGTQAVRVYNRCSRSLIVSGFFHQIRVPQNGNDLVILPVLPDESRWDPKDLVLDARGEGDQELGTKRDVDRNSYHSLLIRRQVVVGGRDGDVHITGVC
jgi:hypothetical protein